MTKAVEQIPYFSRAFILRYEDGIRELARTIIEKFLDLGELEFVEDFAIPFSAGSLTQIALVTEAMAEAARNPGVREDIPPAVIADRFGGRPITDEQHHGGSTAPFLDGLDTTRGMMVNIAYHLATRNDAEARTKQSDLLRELLDRLITFEPTTSGMARTHSLDLARSLSPHAGLGTRRFLQVNFARIQITIAFEELLAAGTNFRLKPGADVPRYKGSPISGPSVLRLEFDRRGSSAAGSCLGGSRPFNHGNRAWLRP
jgi:hypothetical protein